MSSLRVHIPRDVTTSIATAVWLLNHTPLVERPQLAVVWDEASARPWELAVDRSDVFHVGTAKAKRESSWTFALQHYPAWRPPASVTLPTVPDRLWRDGGYRTAQHDVLMEIERCMERVHHARFWGRQRCSSQETNTCPPVVIDMASGIERLRQPTDVLPECAMFACALDDIESDMQEYQDAALSGLWRGLEPSDDSPVRVMALQDMVMLAEHVRRSCRVPKVGWWV